MTHTWMASMWEWLANMEHGILGAFPPPTNLNAHAHTENTVWFTNTSAGSRKQQSSQEITWCW